MMVVLLDWLGFRYDIEAMLGDFSCDSQHVRRFPYKDVPIPE
jgi:hypothetical protein